MYKFVGAGIFFIVAYNVISAIFCGLGDSKSPLIFVAIACIVNIIGDYIFVAIFNWNVVGAALATVITQAVSAITQVLQEKLLKKGNKSLDYLKSSIYYLDIFDSVNFIFFFIVSTS